MTIPRLSDIVGILNRMAPPRLAESWDNPGLQVGDPSAPIDRIMVALDADCATVESAVRQRCSLLLTHHPLIFKPLKRISSSDSTGAAVASAIRNGLAVFSAHTNYDIAAEGVNDILAALVGLPDPQPLQVTQRDEMVKLVAFVPTGHEQKVMQALFAFSGFIGRYRDCSFRTGGKGT
ncbi:MAG TPA: Nif3-like dinuclear metal center hexameric protein, partial [Verrucomicrobiae bacterium]|nr:Nif3-like dinuclear metal center hexameric protein [Verrucomicrobiae bacterium]